MHTWPYDLVQIVGNDHRNNSEKLHVIKFEKIHHSIFEYLNDKVGLQAN